MSFRISTLLALACMCGCSPPSNSSGGANHPDLAGDTASSSPPQPRSDLTAESESTPTPLIDKAGKGRAELIVQQDGTERKIALEHIVSYRFEHQLAGPPTAVSTWVLFTPQPVDAETIKAHLERNQHDLMEAQPYFPQAPLLTLEFLEGGVLRQISCYAEDETLVLVGPAIQQDGVQQQLALKGGRLTGALRVSGQTGERLSLICELDVRAFAKRQSK